MQSRKPPWRMPFIAALAAMVPLIAVPAARAHAASGRELYAPCVVCHQPSGWGAADGSIPNLAGQQQRYLERQLALFKSGARVSDAMQIVTAHPSFKDQRNIDALAAYLSALEPNPRPVTGSGDHLRVGQDLYTHICAACHGPAGRGNSGNRVPRIAGQHYPYLLRQIEAAASLHKDLAPPEMTSALRSMRPQEKDALADFVSRLGESPGEPEGLLDPNRPPERR